MELRFLFLSGLTVCGTLIGSSAYAQAPQFSETEEMVELETTEVTETVEVTATTDVTETTEVTFPEVDDFPEVAIPEPSDLPPIPTSPEFIPDESLMMDSLLPMDDFPDFDGGFEIPDFGSELDPARVIRERIQVRRARMKVASDPALQAIRTEADATSTAYEYREKMQQYYTELYDGVQKLHPDLQEVIDTERKQFIASVSTARIRPTERPAHLPPLPETQVPPAPADPAVEIDD